ncbi:MAG: HAD family hydrolase [Candidatus Poseidoniales archaeon]
MKPLSEINKKRLEKIKVLMFDLDGTFISNDTLKSSTYRCLEKLKDNQIKTVVVTGRPAGWCDLIARWWPVNSVIGENGALSYSMLDGTMDRQFFDNTVNLKKSKEFLDFLFDEIKANFGDIHLASDQSFRQWDLALDISEENNLSLKKVREIYDFCISKGANAAISNIHLNIWYGNYTKCDMALKILHNWNIKIDECVYVGDSPNDSPMFKKFPFSVGVKSVLRYSDFMQDYPSYVTERDGNQGFEDLVDSILSTK